MTEDRPSERVVLQRIRNRIIEYLATTASVERQRDDGVPPVETINQWEDWVQPAWLPGYDPPTFSSAELDAIRKYHGVWDEVADSLPDDAVSIDDVAGSAYWQALCDAAREALATFEHRGKLPEDCEAPE
jgi:hypothetical protein